MGVVKVEIDIIANVTMSSIGRAMHSVKNGNVIMCLTSQWPVIFRISQFVDIGCVLRPW